MSGERVTSCPSVAPSVSTGDGMIISKLEARTLLLQSKQAGIIAEIDYLLDLIQCLRKPKQDVPMALR